MYGRMLSWGRNRLLIVALGALWALFVAVELAGRDFASTPAR